MKRVERAMKANRTTPFFSVVVPVFNGAGTLPASLEAIKASSFTDFELIVVDDGSTDGSAELAGDAGARILRTSGRLGPGSAPGDPDGEGSGNEEPALLHVRAAFRRFGGAGGCGRRL